MVRPRVRVAAGVLAAVVLAVGCGPPPVDPQQALTALKALASRNDLTYRFELVVLSDGSAAGQGSARAVGAVAGRDSAYRLTLGSEANGQTWTDTVISGKRAFRRSDTQPWEATARPDGFSGGDLATFLPLVGPADLSVVGRVDFDGASRVQLSNAGPIPFGQGRDDQAVITRLDLLIADDGTPIRAVAEFDPAAGASNRVIVEFRFTDFGAEISIQPPVIP